MAEIYALIDSREPQHYRYIGKTVRGLSHRLHQHWYRLEKCTNRHKANWMNKVVKDGGIVEAFLIAPDFNIGKSAIGCIKLGQTWKHLNLLGNN